MTDFLPCGWKEKYKCCRNFLQKMINFAKKNKIDGLNYVEIEVPPNNNYT